MVLSAQDKGTGKIENLCSNEIYDLPTNLLVMLGGGFNLTRKRKMEGVRMGSTQTTHPGCLRE